MSKGNDWMYITCFCHLLQTYKFKCIKKPKKSKEEIMWTALWLEEFSICWAMTRLVLINGRYKKPISHMPPARFTSHHEWERARERERDPFSCTPDLISMPEHLLRPLAAAMCLSPRADRSNAHLCEWHLNHQKGQNCHNLSWSYS